MNNGIDMEKVPQFIAEHTPDDDYVLVDWEDTEKLADMYDNSSFKVIALIKKGVLGEKPLFLASRAEELGFGTGFNGHTMLGQTQ